MYTLFLLVKKCILLYNLSISLEERMENNRRRKTRKSNIIRDTISNKNFIIISSILLVIIVICIVANVILNINEAKKVAEEQKRISDHVEEIYSSIENDIASINDFKANSIIRLSAIGDILLGNNLQKSGKNTDGLYTDIFEDISKYFNASDIVMGTYETDVTDENKAFANSIKESGVDLVTLAHNHSLDNGIESLNATKEYLESIGIQTTGIYNEEAKDRVKIIEIKGVKLAILSYTYDNGEEGVNIYSEELAKEDLTYANENADFSIVLMHWGDVYKNEPNENQKGQAQFLVDNGADIIIGAHPSVVQKMEILQNKEGKDCLVAYSLGDFTSDFSYENSNLELVLNIQIYYDAENDNVSLYKVDYTPIYMNDYGKQNTINRYKLLDLKNEIANYGKDGSDIDKKTYDKLVRGIDRLNGIIE